VLAGASAVAGVAAVAAVVAASVAAAPVLAVEAVQAVEPSKKLLRKGEVDFIFRPVHLLLVVPVPRPLLPLRLQPSFFF